MTGSRTPVDKSAANPASEGTAPYSDFALYKRLLWEARTYWPHIFVMFLISLLSTPLALLAPLPMKIAIDSVLGDDSLPGFLHPVTPSFTGDSDTAMLVFAASLIVVLALARHVQDLSALLLRAYTSEKLVLAFRAKLFRHVQRLSLAYHDSKGTSDSSYRIQYDAPAIQYIAIDGVIPYITASVTLVTLIVITVSICWQLSLVALLVTPALMFLSRTYRPKLRTQSRELKRLDSASLSVIQEVLTGVRIVKAFGQEDREHARFMNRSNERLRVRLGLVLAEGGFSMLVGLATAVGTASALFFGVRFVQSGTLTLGDLTIILAYLAQLYDPLKTISNRAATIQTSMASAERAFALLDQAPDVIERPNARPLGRSSGALSFQNVSFAYGPERAILKGVTLEIVAGTRLGIAGATGAGKTTLLGLLPRFYDPTAGAILLDGVDLRDYKVADLRNQFAIVLQEPVLFSTSIAENIAYARPDATEAEITAAAKAANAHDFIVKLPDGYYTRVGERGMRLSGGERQRISLARAFLKDAPILILDEPTSSVDVKTEAGIMESMERLMSGRTSIMIAHRLSTLDSCDMRVEIDGGEAHVQDRPFGRGEAPLDSLEPARTVPAMQTPSAPVQ